MECNCSKSGDYFLTFLLALTSAKTFYEVIKLNPNVAETFGPKALRSLYIGPSRNDWPFSRPHRMFNMISSLKMINRPLLTQSIPF
jgi:hypothetical protein